MSFVFLSYSREDLGQAEHVAKTLAKEKLDVFWDERLLFGEDHAVVITDRLDSAACVLVLWSKHSAESHWVRYEANEALQRGSLVEARLDKTRAPAPFGVMNVADLSQWRGGAANSNIQRLVQSVASKVQSAMPTEDYMSLAAPRAGRPVTDAHLALVHTCWWDEDHSKKAKMDMYRWDICVYGTKQALDRIEEVTYFLHPAYEIPEDGSFSVNRLGADDHRGDAFKLKQLANGHSLVRASIKMRDQIDFVRLTRYINLFDSDYRIDDYIE